MILLSLKWGKSYHFPRRFVRSFVGAPPGDALSPVLGTLHVSNNDRDHHTGTGSRLQAGGSKLSCLT